MYGQILHRLSMPILHSAVANRVSRQLPFMKDVLNGLWGPKTALVQFIEAELSMSWFHGCDFFDAEIFRLTFKLHILRDLLSTT